MTAAVAMMIYCVEGSYLIAAVCVGMNLPLTLQEPSTGSPINRHDKQVCLWLTGLSLKQNTPDVILLSTLEFKIPRRAQTVISVQFIVVIVSVYSKSQRQLVDSESLAVK